MAHRSITRLLPALLAISVMGAACAAHAQDGIPQMDTTWFANQLLWLAVSFALLFVLVSRVIAPSIHSVLHTRETAIRDAIAQAEEARAHAQLSQGQATHVAQAARAKAAELMAQAQAENSREAAAAMAKLDHELSRKAGHADAALDDAVRKAQAGMDAAADSLAETIAEQLLGAYAAQNVDELALKRTVKR